MSDPKFDDPRRAPSPLQDQKEPPHSALDPAADPRLDGYDGPRGSRRSGLIAAGIIAILLVIALIAFTTGPATDPGTTAVIPDQSEDTAPPPADMQ